MPIAPIRRLSEARLDLVWSRHTGNGFSSSTGAKSEALHHAVSALLAGWPLEDVEESAWEFALDGWQKPPPLIGDYDQAFALLLDVLKDYRLDSANRGGTDGLVTLFDELRNRVQFIQTRGADIRLSSQVDELLSAGAQRLVPVLQELVARLTSAPQEERAKVMDTFEREGRGGLLVSLGKRLGPHQPELAASLTMLPIVPAANLAKAAVGAVAGGVVGNAAYDSLKLLATYASP